MLRLINILLGMFCLTVLASDVLAATRELELKRNFGAAPHDKIGMAEAISIAEDRTGGRALDASLVKFSGANYWDVDVLSRGRSLHVSIDAHTGSADVAPSRH